MTKLIISKTQKSDINDVVSIEANKENSKFIMPNTKEEHLNLLLDKDIEHLVLKTEHNIFIGFLILAGLKNDNKSIEFRRIIIIT